MASIQSILLGKKHIQRPKTYWKYKTMMKNWFRLIFLVAAFGLFLGACGQKGDLYLPESETATEEEEKEEEKNDSTE